MSTNNNIREWIANNEIILGHLERVYNALQEIVADYGYIERQMGTQMRTSQLHRFMFIVPKPGMAAKFQAQLKDMGIDVWVETANMDGVPTRGFLLEPVWGRSAILAQMSRKIVKDSQSEQQAIIAQTTRLQGRE